MPHPEPDLAAFLGSRICHDLISPLGAIGNGLELLSLSGHELGPEAALIRESVANANARIRFFRVAFGQASADQVSEAPELRAILRDLTQGGRLVCDWRPDAACPRPEAKLAFLLLMCVESALAYGGQVSVATAGGRWTIAATAGRMRRDEALWAAFAAAGADPSRPWPLPVTAAQVHFPLAVQELARQGRRLAIETGEGTLLLRA